MDATASVDKSREELWYWSQTDPRGLVDFTFELQAEVRRLHDITAQKIECGGSGRQQRAGRQRV